MKNNHINRVGYSILTLLILTFVSACKKDYFDINQNPNSPTEESITPELILPSALHATAARMATSYDYSAHWMGYWARSGTYGPSNPLENYDINTSYQQTQWSEWYNILQDVNLMEQKATAANRGFYAGAAKVLKSIGFMYLVDQYNNVPYSQAFNLAQHILPGYDKGEDIYKNLLVQLAEADALFAAANTADDPSIASADIMFHGDALMWRKLANTQRLKLLIHESQVAGVDFAGEIAKIKADGSGFLQSGETAEVQPTYVIDKDKQNPFYNTYKLTFDKAIADNFNRANNYILNKFRTNNDERYKYVFSEAVTPLKGNLYWGYNFGFVNEDPNEPKAANSSDVAGPGLAKSPTQPQWLFTSVESMFLQAEAIQRGWLTGNAEAAYRAAVKESFKWLGVANADATAETYLNQSKPIVSWSTADTPDKKIALIVMQKYLALIGINNFEAWVDYRRLGVPADLPLSESPSRGSRKIPLRLLYPQTEYNFNSENVKAQGTIDAQTSKIFWDVN